MGVTSTPRGPGRPRLSPGEETVPVLIRAPASLWAAVDGVAEDQDQTRAEAVREALELWLAHHASV